MVLLMSSTVYATENCRQNIAGKIVCAPVDGTITVDKYGEVVCGIGNCIVNPSGTVLCSILPGGTAIINDKGVAVCSSGGCRSASQKYCRGAR